jgi:hypothetical protein
MLAVAALGLLATARLSKADTLVFDDFSSYPLGSSLNPPPSGAYAANWLSDGAYEWPPGNGAWAIGRNPIAAPSYGQFAYRYGLPGTTDRRWLSFTVEEDAPLTSASLQFDYLVQASTNLYVRVSSVSPTSALVDVPFTFQKRYNVGEIEDNTGSIDLTPYLVPGGKKLVVVLDGEATGSSYSYIKIDNFRLETGTRLASVPLPGVAWGVLGLLTFVGLARVPRAVRPGRRDHA